MPDFNVRSDSVNVEQVMEQIRARIREKRGVDYTEQQIRELAAVKLEKFLDPRAVRSDLVKHFKRRPAPAPPKYTFEAETIYETHRGPLRWIRRVLHPILKLLFNPNPLIQALHIQTEINAFNVHQAALAANQEALHFELMHNLVLEVTRLGIDVKNLKMQVETLTSRMEFNERRARTLESAVMYRPAVEERDEEVVASPPPAQAQIPAPVAAVQAGASQAAAAPAASPEGPGQRSRRRRRRRGRRGGPSATAIMAAPAGAVHGTPDEAHHQPEADSAASEDASGPDESDDEQ